MVNALPRPLSVCHVISGDLWAGAEVQAASLLRALNQYEDLRLSAVLFNKGRLLDEVSSAGISVALFEESRSNAWDLFGKLRMHFKNTRPHLIHTHRYKEHVLGALSARLSHNPIVVQTFHGLEENLKGWDALKMTAYTILNTICGRWTAKGFIGVSGEIAAVLASRYPGRDVRCIRNGVELHRIKPMVESPDMRGILGVPLNAFVVGTVCRLTPVKGLEHLVHAFRIILGKSGIRPKRLIIVGDGPLRTELEERVRCAGIAAQTLFLGARSDVYDVMATFDVLALPSLHEGIPTVLLEAMALGVPIVASKVGGIPEILNDRREALLVPSRDEDALAEAIERFEANPSLCEQMRSAARTRVEQEFSIARAAALTRAMYRGLAVEGRS